LWSSIFFWVGIGALLLLGISEVVSHRYSQRKDELVSEQQSATERRHDEEMARVHLETAQARERQAQAELALEQLRKKLGPRQIDRNAFLAALKDQPRGQVEVLFIRDDPEAFSLALGISQLLKEAGWDAAPPAPVRTGDIYPTSPSVMSVGGQPSGVTVVAHSITRAESNWFVDKMRGRDWARTPWTVLCAALSDALGSVNGSGGARSGAPPEGQLRVVVAPRP
jgi:hypothetical protein